MRNVKGYDDDVYDDDDVVVVVVEEEEEEEEEEDLCVFARERRCERVSVCFVFPLEGSEAKSEKRNVGRRLDEESIIFSLSR